MTITQLAFHVVNADAMIKSANAVNPILDEILPRQSFDTSGLKTWRNPIDSIKQVEAAGGGGAGGAAEAMRNMGTTSATTGGLAYSGLLGLAGAVAGGKRKGLASILGLLAGGAGGARVGYSSGVGSAAAPHADAQKEKFVQYLRNVIPTGEMQKLPPYLLSSMRQNVETPDKARNLTQLLERYMPGVLQKGDTTEGINRITPKKLVA